MSWMRKVFLFSGMVAAIFAMAVINVDVQAQGPEAADNGVEDSAGPDQAGIQPCTDCTGLGSTNGAAGVSKGVSQGLSASLYNATINGGYAAAGVGMRGRGWGTILITDIPTGATVSRAYLFWSIISPAGVTTAPSTYAQGKVNCYDITGTLMGSSASPCWGGGKIFGYMADVTSIAATYTNNRYRLDGFQSGYKWGQYDPWVYNSFPAMEGASLVIVFQKAAYPLTKIVILNGVETLNGTTSTTTFSGFTASSLPVARTTFIVADGQSLGGDGGESVKFNGIEMPTSFCDGTDRQDGINYPYGNLQDTNTAYVKVAPGATSATATITAIGTSSNDCLTWLAQVFAIYDGNVDTDGDALKDAWEIYGYDYDNNGTVDVDLPALGAKPYHKDIFVEVDYMAAGPGETKSHQPDPSVVTTAVSTFKNAPNANNPDGTAGINIHVDISNQVAHDDDLNPVWTEFDAIKNANFPVARRDTHHYCLFAHKYSNDTSSGLSRGIPASDFIVSLGGWSSNPGTPDQQRGTFIHELGHNLGLRHGGNDDNNYKPNYLSIMNYFFQMPGVYRSGSWGNYDYQRIAPYTLNESSLIEANGVGTAAAGYGTMWYDPSNTVRTTLVNAPIDWNWNGSINASAVSVNINGDHTTSGADIISTSLGSQNNWQNITYNGGSIGPPPGGVKTQVIKAEQMPPELTYEEYLKFAVPSK